MIDLHLSAFAPRWRFLYAVRIDAYDIRFIAKLKHEFITQEIDKKLQEELNEIDNMYNMMQA